MPVKVRTKEQIEKMRISGRMLAQVHEAMRQVIRPGISTAEINAVGEEEIRRLGGIPNFKNYRGFPAAVCISVNDVVVHGIPSEEIILKEGDIVSLDAGLIYKGWHSDAARTWGVGTISAEAESLIKDTRESFFKGMRLAKAGNHLYDISAAIGWFAESRGRGIVRELTGHGIGPHLHENPMIPNFEQKGRGILLVPGMTFAIEPMLTAGGEEIRLMPDGWTIRTEDGSLAAHYENTILITNGELEILTGQEGGYQTYV